MPEKEGQIKSLLPYDTSRGGQVIAQIDLSVIDSNRKSKLYNYASAKMDDIKRQYEETNLAENCLQLFHKAVSDISTNCIIIFIIFVV